MTISVLFSCNTNNLTPNEIEKKESFPIFQVVTEQQQQIMDDALQNCAYQHNYTFQMNIYQECLDEGLKKDSTIAYLWQQKAMPYFKARKYEVGMKYIDKAVIYSKRRYLPYRAFIKCIFSKQYKEAITDFEESISMVGNQYEMDHSYKFYIALSYLQLNQFEKAEAIFTEDIKRQEDEMGEDGAHHLDLFYYGIAKYELNKWEEAIEQFDKALKIYPNFSDVLAYKGISLLQLEKMEEATIILQRAKEEGLKGNTINEANVIYETYPYQVRWKH
jgi:tetratricopeptide (TPR) repeat protein